MSLPGSPPLFSILLCLLLQDILAVPQPGNKQMFSISQVKNSHYLPLNRTLAPSERLIKYGTDAGFVKRDQPWPKTLTHGLTSWYPLYVQSQALIKYYM
jgi:hypothetical protein